MAREQNYEQSSAPSLCANNCGFFANPTTLNLCSKCYRDHVLKEIRSQQMEAIISSTAAINLTDSVKTSVPETAETASSRPSRCEAGECRKRVGLIGFKCKCEATYCGAHRFPEDHSCTFDFKAVGKKAIAKANPLMKKPKLDKIVPWPSSEYLP